MKAPRGWFLAAAFTVIGAGNTYAQRAPGRPGGQDRSDAPADSVRRFQLEGQIRRDFTQLVRQRVGLNDQQMARLGPITQRYEQQRRRLQMEERSTRVGLQAAILSDEAPDSVHVDELLRRLLGVQKRRVELIESEQRELATIMTPIQRAKYMALQEQVRRRLEQMRQRRPPFADDGPPGPRRGRPPPEHR